MEEYVVGLRDNAPAISTVAITSFGGFSVSMVINIVLVLLLLAQLGYTVWKWRNEHIDRKEKRDGVNESDN